LPDAKANLSGTIDVLGDVVEEAIAVTFDRDLPKLAVKVSK
jgi:hypothetical protein